jgi:hypothetical protein
MLINMDTARKAKLTNATITQKSATGVDWMTAK